MQFGDLPIHELAKAQIENCFTNQRMPHALLIEGQEDETIAVAQLLAKVLVCENKAESPCGVCGGCIKAVAGSHPDIMFAEGGTTPRSFKVDTIRAIRGDTGILSQEGGYKVYILHRAESMSAEAQNALLKVLEEPPNQVIFILTSQSANALLLTIRSRVQIISLNSNQKISEQATELAQQVAKAVLATNELLLLTVTAPFIKEKELFKEVLIELTLLIRDACVNRSGGTAMLGNSNSATQLSLNLTPKHLFLMMAVVEYTEEAILRNANMNLLVTSFCAKLREAAGR